MNTREISASGALLANDGFINVRSDLAVIELTFPAIGGNVQNGNRKYINDTGNNAGTNQIKMIPNGATVGGQAFDNIFINGGSAVYELFNGDWKRIDGQGKRFILYQTAPNTGTPNSTSDAVLDSYTVPAKALLNVGDKIEITAKLNTNAAAVSADYFELWIGGSAKITTSILIASDTCYLKAIIEKTGANTQHVQNTIEGILIARTMTDAGGTYTDTSSIALAIHAKNPTIALLNSIILRFFRVELIRA